MKKYDYLPYELRKLGLNENEADVYLILLESGHISIGKIAEKSGLSRPTVYRALESLQKKEVINKVKKGKKSQYIAGSPDSFLKILKVQKRKVEEQEREFLRIISVLNNKYHLLSNKHEIKSYQGLHSQKILLEDFSTTDSKNIKVFIPPKSKTGEKISKTYASIKKRLVSVDIREISSAKQKTPSFVNKKVISENIADPDIVITADKVYLFEKENGYVIKQDTAVKAYKNFFNMLWESLGNTESG